MSTIAEREHPFVPDSQIPRVVLVSILSKTPFSSFPSESGSYAYCDNSFLRKSELLTTRRPVATVILAMETLSATPSVGSGCVLYSGVKVTGYALVCF